jgi:gliding motility-associated-like protein
MPVANFDSDIFQGCAPQTVRFTNLSESSEQVKSWLWDFGNERAFNNENPAPVIYTEAGNFAVSLTVTSEKGCADTYEVPGMIRIFPTPKAGFTLFPFETDIITPVIEIVDLSSGANQWRYDIEDQEPVNQREFRYTFKDTGAFVIRQVVSNEEGCSDYFERTANVRLGYRLYIPSAFTPNDDGNNDRFRIYGEGLMEVRVEIYSRWGELLYISYDYENGWDGTTRLGDKAVPGGVYFYRVFVQDRSGIHWNYQGNVTVLK